MDIFGKIYANYMSNIPEKELYIISDLLLIWAVQTEKQRNRRTVISGFSVFYVIFCGKILLLSGNVNGV